MTFFSVAELTETYGVGTPDKSYMDTLQNCVINTAAILLDSQILKYQIVANGALEVLQSMLRNQCDRNTLIESFLSGAYATVNSRLTGLATAKFLNSCFDHGHTLKLVLHNLIPGLASGACGQITRNYVHRRPMSKGLIQSMVCNMSQSLLSGAIYGYPLRVDVLPQNHLQRDYGRDSVKSEKKSLEINTLLAEINSEAPTSSLSSPSTDRRALVTDRIAKIQLLQAELDGKLLVLNALLGTYPRG
jgi:hypothetical protein